MPPTKPIDELRRYAKERIVAKIDALGVAKAASQLRVSRQAIYDIRNGTYCPSLGLIQRASEVWGLEFTFRGLKVGKKTLQPKRQTHDQSEQMNLAFQALELLDKQQLEEVRTRKTGKTVELTFRFKIPA